MPNLCDLGDLVTLPSYYVEPPYTHPPALVEYITNFQVTWRGILAEILSLDNKGLIEIEQYTETAIILSIKDKKKANEYELKLLEYLEGFQRGDKIYFFPFDVASNKPLLETYSKIAFQYAKQYLGHEEYNIPLASLPSKTFIVTLELFKRLLKASYYERDFILKLFITNLKNFLEISAPLLFVIAMTLLRLLLMWPHFTSLDIVGAISTSLILAFFATLVASPFLGDLFETIRNSLVYSLNFLNENETARKCRSAWLDFQYSVISYSELEKMPLRYYSLWGPFYYYVLAIGGIKDLKII